MPLSSYTVPISSVVLVPSETGFKALVKKDTESIPVFLLEMRILTYKLQLQRRFSERNIRDLKTESRSITNLNCEKHLSWPSWVFHRNHLKNKILFMGIKDP